ncbi:MAG TPA: hypothetical protein VFD41_06115 [Actinomycetales bacterium]|nr:hypothetical protein [Actinomycetales bacterium]
MTTPAPPWAGVDLMRMTPLQRRLFDAAYSLGWLHGTERGRELADAEAAEHWRGVAAYVRGLGRPSSVTHAQLVERRNTPTGARPMPTRYECATSWIAPMTAKARRDGASPEQVAALIADHMRPYQRQEATR